MLKNSKSEISIQSMAEDVRKRMLAFGPSITDEQVLELCKSAAFESRKLCGASFEECSRVIHLIFCTLRCELEILQDYADDPQVSEIMVNGPEDVFIETCGRIERADVVFESKEQLEHIIQRIAAAVGREINDLNPILDARLSDGSRVNAVNSNIAVNGPVLNIRRFSKCRMTMDDIAATGCITKEAADFCKNLVKAAYNIMVCGGTSSGKTTFLNILSDYIPENERIIVIEDSAELQIRNHENIVRMEAKQPNVQGKGGISIRDLIRTSLRQRPDRIIVGEVRGVEVIDMIAAMSTGHEGSLSTGHSNSAKGMIKRLEAMYLSESEFPLKAVQSQIEEGIEILIYLKRMPDGRRTVTEISELTGYKNGEPEINEIFEYSEEKGLCRTGKPFIRCEKLQRMQTKHP